jgi:hypothetical protein
VRDPLKYKWSLLSGFDNSDNSDSSLNIDKPTNSTPFQPSVDSSSKLGTRNTIIIVFAVFVFICISVLGCYKAKQYRNKIKNKKTYQQNISSSENISISGNVSSGENNTSENISISENTSNREELEKSMT